MNIDVDLLQRFEAGIDPQHLERSDVPATLIGYGEISAIFRLGDAPVAYKRMPLFSDAGRGRGLRRHVRGILRPARAGGPGAARNRNGAGGNSRPAGDPLYRPGDAAVRPRRQSAASRPHTGSRPGLCAASGGKDEKGLGLQPNRGPGPGNRHRRPDLQLGADGKSRGRKGSSISTPARRSSARRAPTSSTRNCSFRPPPGFCDGWCAGFSWPTY